MNAKFGLDGDRRMAKGNYISVNGLKMYYEVHGKGEPLILLPGGLESIGMMKEVLEPLAQHRQVIGVELQAHGHTADIERPIDFTFMADDIAGLIEKNGFARADMMGYSLGGGAALRTVIQYPRLVRRLILISTPFKRRGWYPDVLVGMGQMTAASAEMMKEGPMYKQYAAVAPRPEDWPRLVSKVGALLAEEYDWTAEVRAIKSPVLLVYGDSDSIPPGHAAEFFSLLGGGRKDAGWDSSAMPRSRLSILPGTTHYNIISYPYLASMVNDFLEAEIAEE